MTLDDVANAFAKALGSELQSIQPDTAQKSEFDQLKTDIAALSTATSVNFSELLAAEKRLLHFLGDEALRRRTWVIRERFGLVFGEAGLQKYSASSPPDPDSAARALLQEDLNCLLNQIYASYSFNVAREKHIGNLKRWLVLIATIASILALAGATVKPNETWLIWIIMASGIVGALISILRRLQTLAGISVLDRDPFLELSSLAYGKTGVFIALFSGAVFSLLLYCIFASGLVGNATFFPSFSQDGTPAKSGVDLRFFVNNFGPMAVADYAKIVVWSFVAGFAERFVPDVLDRLVNQFPAESKPK